jgi:hypothetical protein
MKKKVLRYFVMAFALISCDCPPGCVRIIRDTIKVDVTCYRCIDSLKIDALKEVDEYRSAAIYQVDTMRANLRDELAYLDSLRNAKFKDNMFIKSTGNADVYFDSITGKPVLKLR